MKESLRELLKRNPVIPAVKDDPSLKRFLKSSNEIVFVLYGNIMTLNDTVRSILKKDKVPLIHIDLIQGLGSEVIVMDYFHKYFRQECGIITTRSKMVKKAQDYGIWAVQRYFMLDSLSMDSALHSIASNKPDAIEIMPGIIPRVINQINQKTNVPIIAGGLIQTALDVEKIIAAGATSVSTSKIELWNIEGRKYNSIEKAD